MRVEFHRRAFMSVDVEFIDIHTGRDGNDVVSRPATDEDRARYAAEYEAFSPPVLIEAPPATKDEPPAVKSKAKPKKEA